MSERPRSSPRSRLEPRGVTRVVSSRDPAFDEVWGALEREFGPRGEIERRAVVEAWLDGASSVDRSTEGAAHSGDLEIAYHLVGVRDDAGALVAARDHHVVVDRVRGVVVVYLAHALVAPDHRRAGLGERLRQIARADGEAARAALGGASTELVLAAEMEPWDAADASSTARLVAYGRAGFRAIDPARIAYAQPDFRDLDSSSAVATPIPLLAIVQLEGEARHAVSQRLAESFVRSLHAVFATHCRARDLEPLLRRSLDAIARGGDIELLSLPTSAEDHAALAALSAPQVRASYPLQFHRPSPEPEPEPEPESEPESEPEPEPECEIVWVLPACRRRRDSAPPPIRQRVNR